MNENHIAGSFQFKPWFNQNQCDSSSSAILYWDFFKTTQYLKNRRGDAEDFAGVGIQLYFAFAKRGISGYPDGIFAGPRFGVRYVFAVL
jgi:hypothetical protein